MTVSRYAVPEQLSVEAVLEAFETRFAVEADPATTVDCVVYDTFDGLVRAAGDSLRWEAGRLALVDGDGRERAAVDRASAPSVVVASDLPGEATADVIGVRAASPVAELHVSRRAWRLLDQEAKTVARVALEQPSIGGTRLSLIGVRGYDKALKRARRIVTKDLQLTEPEESLADEAVRRAGGTPGGISSKLEVALEPDQRADRAAVVILTQLTAAIEANLPGTIADTDTEFLHDLRVAVRRTRALQRELKRVFPPDDLARFRKEFRRLQEITGPSRDLDVYVLEFDDFVGTLSEPLRGDLEPLRTLLLERQRRERAVMVRALRSRRTQVLLDEWRHLIERLPDLPEDERPDAARRISKVAAARISTVYGQMLKMGAAIDEEAPPAALHDLRKKGKELRYLLEFFASLFPSGTVEPMIATLKSLQNTLGRYQDREVQSEMLRALGDAVATTQGGPAALMAMGVLVEHLAEEQAQARAEFADRFKSFAGKRRRRSVKETFG